MEIKWSVQDDPAKWETPNEGVILFLNPEEAKKAEALFARVQNEAYAAGLEAAAKACDEASDLHHNGGEWMDACDFCASEIRDLLKGRK